MKLVTLLTLALTSLFAVNALAGHSSTASSNAPSAVAQLAPVELTGVAELCPAGVTCVANGTVITMKTIVKCGEKLGAVSAEAIEVGNELHVFVAAPLLTTKEAIVCLGFREVPLHLTLINQYGDVKLHSLHESNVL